MLEEKKARVAYRAPTESEKRNYYAIYELVFDSHFSASKKRSVMTAVLGYEAWSWRVVGSFSTKRRPPRIGRNPKTGEKVDVPAKVAASDQQQPATEIEKVLAMRRYSDLKKQTDKNYAARLRQQLTNASQNI